MYFCGFPKKRCGVWRTTVAYWLFFETRNLKKTLDLLKKNAHENQAIPAFKVILELYQYDEKEFNCFNDLPIDELLKKQKPNLVNWINLDGLQDKTIVQKLGDYYSLHSLLVEDLSNDQLFKLDPSQIQKEKSFSILTWFLCSFQYPFGTL